MTLSVDITHWLTSNGEIPTADRRLRRNVLRLARLIEYGAPLRSRHKRETLVECTRRPGRRACLGLLWVLKRHDHRIEAACPACGNLEAIISGWQGTDWAKGPMAPVPAMID